MSGYSGSFMDEYADELIIKLLIFKTKITDPKLKREFNKIIGIEADKYYGLITSSGLTTKCTGDVLFHTLFLDCYLSQRDAKDCFIIKLTKKEFHAKEEEDKEIIKKKKKIPLHEIFHIL